MSLMGHCRKTSLTKKYPISVYTDYSRSTYDGSDVYYPRSILRSGGRGHTYFTIPPPPDSPPPPIPSKQTGGDNAEVSSIQSTTSASSQSEAPDYENLRPGEMAALMQMNKAVEGEVPVGGAHDLNGDGAVHGAGPIHWMDARYPTHVPQSHITKHMESGIFRGGVRTGGVAYKSVLSRYEPDGKYQHDDRRSTGMSSRLMEIIERDSEMGSRPGSFDNLDESPASTEEVPAAPNPPSANPDPPPPPPLPVATPPSTTERWKKASHG